MKGFTLHAFINPSKHSSFNVSTYVPADEPSGGEEPNREKDNDENEDQNIAEDTDFEKDNKEEDKSTDDNKDQAEDKGIFMRNTGNSDGQQT